MLRKAAHKVVLHYLCSSSWNYLVLVSFIGFCFVLRVPLLHASRKADLGIAGHHILLICCEFTISLMSVIVSDLCYKSFIITCILEGWFILSAYLYYWAQGSLIGKLCVTVFLLLCESIFLLVSVCNSLSQFKCFSLLLMLRKADLGVTWHHILNSLWICLFLYECN